MKVTHCITWKCNLACEYCSRHFHDAELDTQSVLRMIDIFSSGGTLYWSFNGGEPLMRKDIADLARHARGNGMHVVLNTNGTLPEQRPEILKHVDHVNVSVDGPKVVHDRTRNGSFDKMVSGLETLSRAGMKTTFTSVLNASNAEHLDALLNLAETYSARIFFQPVRIQKEDLKAKSSSFFPEKDLMRDAIEYLLTQKKQGRPVASSAEYLRDIAAHWPNLMTKTPCAGGRAYCFVTPTGHVAACCDTLALADTSRKSNVLQNGMNAFTNIPSYPCTTCFPSIPLETNILFERSLFKSCRHSMDILHSLFRTRQ